MHGKRGLGILTLGGETLFVANVKLTGTIHTSCVTYHAMSLQGSILPGIAVAGLLLASQVINKRH